MNSPKFDFAQNLSGGKNIKFQQTQALTSQFESFWSIVQMLTVHWGHIAKKAILLTIFSSRISFCDNDRCLWCFLIPPNSFRESFALPNPHSTIYKLSKTILLSILKVKMHQEGKMEFVVLLKIKLSTKDIYFSSFLLQ